VKTRTGDFLEKSREFLAKRKTCSTPITGPTKQAARRISPFCMPRNLLSLRTPARPVKSTPAFNGSLRVW
jgi:hypothetical protein